MRTSRSVRLRDGWQWIPPYSYEDAVDDIIDGSLVFFMTADDFPVVVVEEYVVPYSLDAGSNTFLD